jgi:hypothetical protein
MDVFSFKAIAATMSKLSSQRAVCKQQLFDVWSGFLVLNHGDKTMGMFQYIEEFG